MDNTDRERLMFNVGAYCRQHRVEKIDLTLTEFCQAHDLNIKNVSAFELGKANNIQYLFYYYNSSDTMERIEFANGLFNIL